MLKITSTLLKHFSRMSGLAVFLLFASGPLYAQSPTRADLPPGPGGDLVVAACTQCHNLKPIVLRRDSLAEWKKVVEFMVGMGAQLLPEEADTMEKYLARNFGPGTNPMKTGRYADQAAGGAGGQQAVSLPEGAGKKLVETRCTLCHDLGIITALTRTKEDWVSVIRNMVEQGAAAKPDEIQTIASYLSTLSAKKSE